MRKIVSLLAAAGVAAAIPVASVQAKPKPSAPAQLAGCGYVSGTVFASASFVGCQGFFAGNAISANKGDRTIQNGAVSQLGGTFGGDWLAKVDSDRSPLVDGLIDFGQTLYGETIVGVHFGNIYNPQNLTLGGQGQNGNVTVFLKYDFGTAGANGIQLLNTRGYSNAALFATGAVPEPSAWALMVLAFGTVGGVMRTVRRRNAPAVAA